MNLKPKYAVKYITGAVEIKKPTDSYVLSIEEDGIRLWRMLSPTISVKWIDIQKITAETQSSVSKTISSTTSGAAAGLILFGPLGALIGAGIGAKSNDPSFLSIVYQDADKTEDTLVLQNKQAHEIASIFNTERTQYYKLNKIQLPKSGNEHENSLSNLDELEKLSKLRDKNIITSEEFNQKKKQLLGL
jgi:hypothetical protein